MSTNALNQKVSLISNSEEETQLAAERLADQLGPGAIVLLQGDLGAGKTTFVKGLVKGFKLSPAKVNSPTFVIMNYYKGRLPIYHFDLYRLGNQKEIETLDFDEYFYGDGISLVEWPERLGKDKPKEHYLVEFKHLGEQIRGICISYPSKHQPRSSQ